MPASQTTWTPNPNLVFTKLDDQEAVLLHLETKEYFSLNETGMRIWELLEQECPPPAIASSLAEEYEIEQEEALSYVQRFLKKMSEEQLVRRSASSA